MLFCQRTISKILFCTCHLLVYFALEFVVLVIYLYSLSSSTTLFYTSMLGIDKLFAKISSRGMSSNSELDSIKFEIPLYERRCNFVIKYEKFRHCSNIVSGWRRFDWHELATHCQCCYICLQRRTSSWKLAAMQQLIALLFTSRKRMMFFFCFERLISAFSWITEVLHQELSVTLHSSGEIKICSSQNDEFSEAWNNVFFCKQL